MLKRHTFSVLVIKPIPQSPPSNSTPIATTILMRFIVSVCTTMKLFHDPGLMSWPSPFSVLSHNDSFRLDLALVLAFIKHQLAGTTTYESTVVSSLCKFAVMTSKALVALLAVVVACISESSSQDTLYQATGSCKVE